MKILSTFKSHCSIPYCKQQVSLWNKESVARAFLSIAITFSAVACVSVLTSKMIVICVVAAFSFVFSRIIIQKYFSKLQTSIPTSTTNSQILLNEKVIDQKVEFLSKSFFSAGKGVHLKSLREVCIYIEKHRSLHTMDAKKEERNKLVKPCENLPRPAQFNTDGTVFIHFTKSKSNKADHLIGRGAYKVSKFAIDYDKGPLFVSSSIDNSPPSCYAEDELRGLKLTQDIPGFLPAFYPVRYIGKRGNPKMRILTPWSQIGDLTGSYVTQLLMKERVSLALQLLNALVAGLKKKLLHRDLKEENILIFFNGRFHYVAITDMGSMCTMNAEDLPRRQQNKTSPRFVSPEFATAMLNQTDLSFVTNEKLDIWSMGLVLYTLLYPSGLVELPSKQDHSRPFIYKTLSELEEDWIPLRLRKMTLSPLESLIKEMLQVNPEKRIGLKQLADYLSALTEDFK